MSESIITTSRSSRVRISCGRAVLVLPILLTASVAFAAQSDPGDYARLLNEAHSKGAVRVLVTLDDSVTLERMKNDLASVNAEMEAKAEVLLAELGQDAMTSGYWNNGIGQVGVYVNAKGLNILANSTNAIHFSPDVTHSYRIRAYDDDGSLDAIETTINAQGFADVEVFLNIDEGDYDIDRNGMTVFRPSPELSDQIARRLNNINTHPVARTFKNYDDSLTRASAPSPSFRVRIDKNAFYGLRESEDVRAIRPIGFVDARPAKWPADVLKSAQADGSAEVIITLRGGAIFSAKTGFMSAKALKAQADANQRAFNDILVNAGTSSTSAVLASYAEIGAIHARLPYDVLARLYKNADPRILSIELNRPATERMTSFLRADDIVKTTKFSEPGQYCFEQTSLRGKFNKTTLEHHLIIPSEDHFKTGDVFVGFRRNSQPDALWLTDGSQWRAYDDNEFPYMAFKGDIRLEPVIKAEVFHAPKDVSEFAGDGEIWVGYGLRQDETTTREDSFQDMINNQRYYRVWRVGDLVVDGLNPEICLTTTQMTERIGIVLPTGR